MERGLTEMLFSFHLLGGRIMFPRVSLVLVVF